MPPQTRKATKKRQSRLSFAPGLSSSPAPVSHLTPVLRYENPSTPTRRLDGFSSSLRSGSETKRNLGPSGPPYNEIGLPTPLPSSQLECNDEQDSENPLSISDSSSEPETKAHITSKTFGRLARPKSIPQNRKRAVSKPLANPVGDPPLPVRCQNNLSFTDEDEVLVTSSRRRRTNPPVAFSSSEDESDPVVSKHSSTRVNNRTPMTTAAGSTESPNTPKSCPRGHLNVSSKRNSRPQRTTFATNLISSSGSNSSEDLIATPKKRRLVAKKTLSEFENESEDSDNQVAEDLREDLDALQDSEIHKKRTRGVLMSSTKTVKQKQLDILKRRRARPKIVELSSNSETMTLKSPRASGTRLQDSDQTSENDVSDEENSGIEAIRQSLRAGDNENDSGVDEDDNGTLGAPDWLKDIPLEFSRHTTKKPIENFKLAVEWMVHNKLNPAFARYDMIYDIAARKLDDQIQGFSGSKFLSPVWTKEFLGVLKSRPELSLIDIPTMFDHKCDACNRSGHPATRQLIFSGKPYNRVTLENLSSDEDSEESDNPHSQEESRPFYLGRTCAANAETGHALHHWRHGLNFYVLSWLKKQGHLTTERIIERENWSAKKREKYSNAVVDGMVESGEMKTLYKEFKENIEAARSAKPERYSYGRR